VIESKHRSDHYADDAARHGVDAPEHHPAF